MVNEEQLLMAVTELDELLEKYAEYFKPHELTGLLLSRVTHLSSMDPPTGKALVQHVWEQLDEIEQGTKRLL
jgi:hypothetical protein